MLGDSGPFASPSSLLLPLLFVLFDLPVSWTACHPVRVKLGALCLEVALLICQAVPGNCASAVLQWIHHDYYEPDLLEQPKLPSQIRSALPVVLSRLEYLG